MAKSLNGQNFVPSKPKKTRQGNGSHSKPSHRRKKYRGQENVNPLSNVQTSYCEWCRRSAAALASPALAGPFLNVENNAGYQDEFLGSVTDLHVGYEGGDGIYGFYLQEDLH